jgi:UPF0755 protein
MRKSRSLLPIIFILLLLAAVFIGVFLAANYAINLPANAAALYGEPSPLLSPWQELKLSAQLVWNQELLTQPAKSYPNEHDFTISIGESPDAIIQRLVAGGLIRDAEIMRTYLIYKGYDTRIQAGDFKLNTSMSAVEIAEELLDATPDKATFIVLPGWRLEEIAASLPTTGFNISPEEFLAFATNPPATFTFTDGLPNGTALEGFFLPGSYEFPREADVFEIVTFMAIQYDTAVTAEMRDGFAAHGLSLRQAVTLASIVEREAVDESEQPVIASVFHNRLQAGMKLEADPTVQYALGYDQASENWWKSPLFLADLEVDSPYNTYLYAGLPPGPIANPTLSALQAVASPENTPYYFFRAACDGSGRHIFAETFEQHQANTCP